MIPDTYYILLILLLHITIYGVSFKQTHGGYGTARDGPSEDVGHEEVHERPQLHEAVLQGGPREEKPPLGVEGQQGLPPLALEVLDVLGLV